MAAPGEPFGDSNNALRVCARRGCGKQVKKRTAKYCSVRCCSLDPERRERLREQTRRASARPLPMSHQLSLSLRQVALDDREAELAQMSAAREDVPAGMSRLTS